LDKCPIFFPESSFITGACHTCFEFGKAYRIYVEAEQPENPSNVFANENNFMEFCKRIGGFHMSVGVINT
jgi:hypothetical protein